MLVLHNVCFLDISLTSSFSGVLTFISLYLASLVRPLQAWGYLSDTAARCMLLLVYTRDEPDNEDKERLRRIFWSCYILER